MAKRRVPVSQRSYYTAKEVEGLLGLTYSALRNKVRGGHIRDVVPPGEQQAVYIKEDVDRLKQEMDAWFTARVQERIPYRLVKTSVEDMPKAVALADLVFGGRNTITVEKRVEWLMKNPDIDYLVKQDEELMGYLTLVPLKPETINDLLTQKRFAKDLTADDILQYEPDTPIDIYGMAIGVRPGVDIYRKREIGKLLLIGVQKLLVELGQRGIRIRSIQAHSSMPDGIRLMRHAGFSETSASLPGLRDFVIDVDSSGLPFIERYKQAFKNWQREQARTKTSDTKKATTKQTLTT